MELSMLFEMFKYNTILKLLAEVIEKFPVELLVLNFVFTLNVPSLSCGKDCVKYFIKYISSTIKFKCI